MESESSGRRAEAEDVLRRLEARIERASEAAERLAAEAAAQARSRGSGGSPGEGAGRASGEGESGASPGAGAAAGAPGKPPPAGWQSPGAEHDGRRARSEIELLTQILESVRELIPPELERRLAEALRELLMAVRALIDWYLERFERKRGEPSEVQDIPIL